jgi:hypothetical protein
MPASRYGIVIVKGDHYGAQGELAHIKRICPLVSKGCPYPFKYFIPGSIGGIIPDISPG